MPAATFPRIIPPFCRGRVGGAGDGESVDNLLKWEHVAGEGPTLRGWRTPVSGRPVIFFLHGNGLCAMTYWPMLSRLRDRFDLVLLDAPGHGRSDSPGRFRGWETDAASCLAAWRSLDDEYKGVSRHVVAHSYGGVLSTFMMADDPRAFDSAVLLDPVYFPPGMLRLGRLMGFFGLLRHTGLARMTARRRDRWPDRDAVHEHLGKKSMFARWEAACFEAYVEHGLRTCDDGVGVRLCCDREIETQIFSTLPYALPRRLPAVQTPTTVISGDSSYDFVVKALPRYCAAQPHYTHRVVAGGHNFMLEQTERTAGWVLEALS